MAEDSDKDESPKKKGFDISRLYPKVQYQDEEFGSRVGHRDMAKAIRKELDAKTNISAIDFALLLVSKSLVQGDDDDPISEARASELAADDEFLEAFITAHPHLYSEFDRKSAGEKRSRKIILKREDGESPTEFLLRAYKDHDERQKKQLKDFNEKIMGKYKGLAGTLSGSSIDALLNNATSSSRIDEILKRATSPQDLLQNSHRFEQSRMPKIHIPPNPIHETNSKLTDVATSMAEMRELYVQQAQMQSNLNTVATEILDNFVIGVEISEKNSKRTLWVAIAAVSVAVASFFYSQFYDGSSTAQLTAQSEMKAILEDIREDAKATTGLEERQNELLLEAIEKSKQPTVGKKPK